jgi:hypothetical protein
MLNFQFINPSHGSNLQVFIINFKLLPVLCHINHDAVPPPSPASPSLQAAAPAPHYAAANIDRSKPSPICAEPCFQSVALFAATSSPKPRCRDPLLPCREESKEKENKK